MNKFNISKKDYVPGLLKKIAKYFIYIFLFPLVCIIFILKPIKKIKFCKIPTNFGHLISALEIIIDARKKMPDFKNTLVIFFFDKKVSNNQLKIMALRSFYINPPSKFLSYLREVIIFLGKKKDHVIDMRFYHMHNILKKYPEWLSDKKNNLYFSEDEKKRGRQLLEKLGISPNDKWICIHNRDSSYLDVALPKQGSSKYQGNWHYHNYRDFPINSMKSASDFFTNNGYYVLRMGSIVKEKFETGNKKIIDYANSVHRNDFADVYLLANCKAYFGSDSGIGTLSFFFKKPCFHINFSSTLIHLLTAYAPWSFIFKRIKNIENGKLLTLKEILNSKFAYSASSEDFIKNNVKPLDNSQEEIKSLATEIENALKGKKIDNEEDKKIQNEFWKIYYKCVDKRLIGSVTPKISPSFLRKNLDLLN